MKKHWYTYLLSICVLLLCGCTESEVLVHPIANNRAVPINFVGSYVDNAATRSINALSTHFSTMGVWGWCNDMNDDNTLVFSDQAVTYNKDSAHWEYNPLQYWIENSQYTFCAYAPHQQGTTCDVCVDNTSHMITINNVTLHGCNLQDSPTSKTKELFTGTTDTDWMVARAGQTAVGTAGMDVEFNMQHILGKFNIRIKVCEELAIRPYLSSITADSIIVGKLPSHGNFAQQLTHTPIISNPKEADTQEWTAYDTDLYVKGTHSCQVSETPTYLIESLVIPHHIGADSSVDLYYTYHYKDGHSEKCYYHMPLTEAFSRFVSGYSHTLTFTICSSRIEFEAGADDWEANTSN